MKFIQGVQLFEKSEYLLPMKETHPVSVCVNKFFTMDENVGQVEKVSIYHYNLDLKSDFDKVKKFVRFDRL